MRHCPVVRDHIAESNEVVTRILCKSGTHHYVVHENDRRTIEQPLGDEYHELVNIAAGKIGLAHSEIEHPPFGVEAKIPGGWA